MNITTAEAADRLGVSEATVKRRLADGELPGAKIGGRWIVYGDKLAPGRSDRRVPAASSVALDVGRAFAQVRFNDRKDLWIPDILNWDDYAQDPSGVIDRASSKCDVEFPVADPVETIEVPKSELLTRGAALLSLEDRVAYQALCNELAPDIEARLSDRVFSARLAPSAKRHSFFKPGVQQWTAFLEASRSAQSTRGPWLVSTDLVSYFDTISHRLLFNALENLRGHERTLKTLRRLLDQWRGDSHHGLPTGPDASRLLGNYFMASIDAFMISKGFEYFRYMDDVRIVAATKDEALLALRTLEIECRKNGLIVSAQKTTVTDQMAEVADPALDIAGYFFQRRLDEARPVLRELLIDAITEERPKVKHAKFALVRLAALVDAPALEPVLERLHALQEAAPESATYLRAFVSNAEVQQALSNYLLKTPQPLLEVYQQAWLIAAMLEVRGAAPAEWVAYARTIADNHNQPSFLRVLAMNLVAKSEERSDLDSIRNEIRASYDPAILRGGAVALARAGVLDREVTSLIEARASHLKGTLDYLKGRNALPSLVQENLWSSVRQATDTLHKDFAVS